MPYRSDLERVVEEQRRLLLAGDRRLAGRLVAEYAKAWRSLRREIDAILERMAEDAAKGLPVDQGWLFRAERLRRVQWQVEEQVGRFAKKAEPAIVAAQKDAVDAAASQAHEAIRAAVRARPGIAVPVSGLSEVAVQNLVAQLSAGSPLLPILASLGPGAAEMVGDALITGVALGWHPNRIARDVNRKLQVPLSRTLTICRTEYIRAYRMSTLRSYRANRRLVKGWRWVSAANARTCAACFALHGSVHDLSEEFHDHPRGRCTMAPVTDYSLEWETGPEAFARLSTDEQRSVLGPAYDDWRAGRVRLRELVGLKVTRQWGATVYTRSLKRIRSGTDAFGNLDYAA